jgi:hypothetical protein
VHRHAPSESAIRDLLGEDVFVRLKACNALVRKGNFGLTLGHQ